MSDESQLLIQARSGAHEFAAFYRHFERPVLGFFVNATGRSDLGADLTAETFARALEGVAAFDPTRGRADQWLFGIARHVLAESYRRGRVEASARARLGMPELILDDDTAETIGRLGSWTGTRRSRSPRSQPSSARRSRRAFSTSASTRTSRGSSTAPRHWCASELARPSSPPHTNGR
jgi:RNA polymerase sigma-70 factor (ECF subfamily)